MYKAYKMIMSLKLWQKILLSMLLGILFGEYFGNLSFIVKPVASLYTNLLKMIIIPIVFFAVLYGITSIDSTESLGKIGIQASVLYLLSTAIAIIIGIGCGALIEPGANWTISMPDASGVLGSNQTSAASSMANGGSVGSMLANIIPPNIMAAMVNGQTLQVVCFAFIMGYALLKTNEKGAVARECVISFSAVVFKMVDVVIFCTPYGVFAIIADVVATYGLNVMLGLGKLVVVLMCAFAMQYLLFGLLLIIFGLNPIKFYKKTVNAQAIAFAASSSKAALATAVQELQDKLGVSRCSASFVMPLGLTINMTATTIYLVICALFFAQASGVEMTLGKYMILALSATIGSIGGAGFAGGGIVMMGMVFSSIGVSVDYIPLILGVDRILDMFRSMINVTGDSAIAVIIDKLRNKLNKAQYDE